MKDNIWQSQEAKARFSSIIRAVEHAPQTITVHGENRAVMMSWFFFNKLLLVVREHMKQSESQQGGQTGQIGQNNEKTV